MSTSQLTPQPGIWPATIVITWTTANELGCDKHPVAVVWLNRGTAGDYQDALAHARNQTAISEKSSRRATGALHLHSVRLFPVDTPKVLDKAREAEWADYLTRREAERAA